MERGCLSLIQGLWICICVFFVTVTHAAVKLYAMDDESVCRRDAVVAYTLHDKDSVLILAHTNEIKYAVNVEKCAVILGPNSESSKKFTHVEFKIYEMPDCDVELILEESPFMTFDKNITPSRKLGCKDKNPKVIISHKGKFMKLTLKRKKLNNDRVYNFRLNVTLSREGPGNEAEGLSTGLKIGISVITVVAAVIILLLICNAIRLKMAIHKESSEEQMFTNLNTHHVTVTNSYTSLPNSHMEDIEHQRNTDNNYLNPDLEISGRHDPHDYIDIQSSRNPVPQSSPVETVNYYANMPPGMRCTYTASPRDHWSDLPVSPPSYQDALNLPQPINKMEVLPVYQNLN